MTVARLIWEANKKNLSLSEDAKAILVKCLEKFPDITSIIPSTAEQIIGATKQENFFILHENGSIDKLPPEEKEALFFGIAFFPSTRLNVLVAIPT